MSPTRSAVPIEIDRSTETDVFIEWGDGHRSHFTARNLRLLCPCATCVDELTGRRMLDPEAVPTDVRSAAVSLIGRYGVDFGFTDGHTTGIYTFEFLRSHCPCTDCKPEDAD